MHLQLKEIRKKSRVTQGELADSVGVSSRTIGAWERGENLPDIEQVWRCAEVLGSTPNDICGWYLEHPEDVPSPPPEIARASPSDLLESEVVSSMRSMADGARQALATVARSMASDPANAAGEDAGQGAASA